MGLEDLYADGADAAEEILSKVFRYEVRKALNPLHLPDFEKLTRALAKSLKGHVAPVQDKAIKSAMNALDAKWTEMTPKARGLLLEEAYGYVGVPIAKKVLPKVEQTLTFAAKDIIPATKKNAILTYDLKIGTDTTLPDDRILRACLTSQAHYITDHFGEVQASLSGKAKIIVTTGLDQGLGSADIAARLHADLAASTGRSLSYWDIIAGVFANRARTVTQLGAFHDAGITMYTWESVLDEATSVQCRFMHGRKFFVHHAMTKFDQVEQETAAGDPDAIKSVQPFLQPGKNVNTGEPGLYYLNQGGARVFVARTVDSGVGHKDDTGHFANQHTDEELADAGIHAPPIHGRCRSTIIPSESSGGSAGAAPAAPSPPAAPPPKLTSGQAKAQAMEKFKIAQSLAENPNFLNPDDVFQGKAENTDPPHMDHDFFTSKEAYGPKWAVNATSKKPKIDDLVQTTPDLDADDVKKYITQPKSLDAASAPKVVQLNGKLYVVSGHEQLAAQKLLGQKVAYCDVVNLDKPLKEVPLVHPVEPPPAESALGHVIHPKEPDPPPPPPALSPALAHPGAPVPGDVILGTKTGGPGGSNEGGFYTGTDGVKRYVKFYKDPSQAEGEHLANNIYRDLGHGAPVSNVFEHDGKLAYASDIIHDAKTLGEVGVTKARAQEAMKGFVADVLVGNWDAVGLSNDNMMVGPGGAIYRIDNGGSFLMRAKEGRKPHDVLLKITEWDKFFDSKNPSYSKLANAAGYSSARDMKDLILPEIQKVVALRDANGGWAGYVNKLAPHLTPADRATMTMMLNARTKLLEEKAVELARPLPPDPRQPIIGHFPAKRLPPRELPPPEGSSDTAYKALVRARLPKNEDERSGVNYFTGGSYSEVREWEKCTTDAQRERFAEVQGRGTAQRSKLAADRIEAFFRNPETTPTPGTVYRGMKYIDDDIFRKLAADEEFDLLATTSTSRTPAVAMRFANAEETYGATNRAFLILKQKSAVGIETISQLPHENELLLHKSTRFRVTGRYRAEGHTNVLILEAEEISNDLASRPEPPAKKPRRKKPATG